MTERASIGPGQAALLIALVVAISVVMTPRVDRLVEVTADLAPKYLIAAAVLAIGGVGTVIALKNLERGLFLLFVLAIPVRASLFLGPLPNDVTALIDIRTASGHSAWIGYPLGVAAIAVADIPLALLWLRALPGLVRRPGAFPWWTVSGGALLLLMEAVSVPVAPERPLALSGLAETARAVLGAAYVIHRTRSRTDLEFCFTAVSLAVILEAAIAIGQFVTRSTLGVTFSGIDAISTLDGGQYVRSSGTFADPQMLAMYLGLFLPLLVASSFSYQARGAWWIRLGGAVGGIVAMILTASRMGWLASACAVGGVWAISVLSSSHRRLIVRAVVVLGLTTIATFPMWDAIARNLVIDRVGSELDIVADLYGVAFNMIRANPLTGVGLNNFSYVMTHYDHSGIAGFYPAPVHNVFVLTLAETGPLGLAGLLAAIAIPAIALWRARRRFDASGRAYLIGLLGGLFAFSLMGLTGWTYYTVQAQVWFFLGIALATAVVSKTWTTGDPKSPLQVLIAGRSGPAEAARRIEPPLGGGLRPIAGQ